MRKKMVRLTSVLLVGALLATACGSDRDAEDASGDSPETTAPSGGTDEVSFGDLESPCGEGDASGATDQGVTDDAITIGYGDDAGYSASPGLNRHMGHALEAMIEWCNEQGGINGRTIDGRYYDAKITEVNNVMITACDTVFMLVGQGWSLDASQEETRVGCDLPAVPAYSVSPAFAHGPGMVQPVPNPVDVMPTHHAALVAELFPEKVKKAAVMYANYSATIDTKDKVLSAFPSHGWEFLDCPQEYTISGEADWKPFAQKLKDCGAEVVYFTGSAYPNFENYLEAARQLDYDPVYVTESNFYDEQFAKWNTNGYADNVHMRMAFVPFEEAEENPEENPATKQYLDTVRDSGGDVSLLGAQATSAFLLWATAADACGTELTRACMAEKLSAITEWDAGGLHAPMNPAENRPGECGMLLKLEGTKFVRADPKKGYACSPDYVSEVTGPVVDRAKLDANRVSRQYG